MSKLLFHPEAEAEYAAARRWYFNRSSNAATRFESEVDAVISRIVEDANVFPHYDGTRRFAVVRRFPYSVVYEVAEGGLYVIAIAHSSRSPGYWQTRV